MSSNEVSTSARLKIDRAKIHVSEVNKLLREEKPFRCVLEFNTINGDKAILPEENRPAIAKVALASGDAIHNLRSALDHAYAAAVFPHIDSPGLRKTIQFPFSETRERLKEAAHNRHAHKVSPDFVSTLIDIAPHGESGGNRPLYLIHELDILDKHALLVPLADYTAASGHDIQAAVPDYPFADFSFVGSKVVQLASWRGNKISFTERRKRSIRRSGILKEDINVPISVAIHSPTQSRPMPLIEVLHQMVSAASSAVDQVEAFT